MHKVSSLEAIGLVYLEKLSIHVRILCTFKARGESVMKKLLIILLVVVMSIGLSGCSQTASSLNVNQELLGEEKEKETQEKELMEAREQVVSKFNNERDVIGTGKFIEDTYYKYPGDEVIATIYNYNSAIDCREFYSMMEDNEWLDKAKAYASKISPGYFGELHEEIIPYVQEFLGDEWSKTREESLAEDEKLKSLTVEDKKEIHRFIEGRYDYYDKQDGKDTGDKYSDTIWKEASDEFGLAESTISTIWMDIDVMTEIWEDRAEAMEQEREDIVCDATLDYEGGKALIAVSEDVMDRFFEALTNENEGTIEELYNGFKVAQVNPGTPVNIIEKKLTRAKVKILDGIYKDSEVWVLIESVKEK